ncbi:hypothetical protein A6D6_00971 [Alcanivorax xiamenensis]|uniref:Uncharacterized protein n=1 Tax=Alcanivorax xiamenensis TaxID=1177156 RepID=A0ABQ6YCA2_9GAMM|nr:DUF493 domain-containing protein [Alcanivorax xiamenensis]KAF0807419.1 hypothetical protein A6D6_00971 [Alcanivorax xiamenensis]
MAIREELWEFPHTMHLKVMGAVDAPLEDAVVDIIERVLELDFDRPRNLSARPSSRGNFIALTARITVQDKGQVETLYRELNACPHVKITL